MRTTYFVLPFLLDIVANLKNGNISIAILSIWFLWHLQEDPLVGQWRRVGYYVHECATDKLIRTETEQMALEEEFRSDGTWEVVGSPWKGTWHRLNNNAYRFVYAPRAGGPVSGGVSWRRASVVRQDL